jgi:hypothetical protein
MTTHSCWFLGRQIMVRRKSEPASFTTLGLLGADASTNRPHLGLESHLESTIDRHSRTSYCCR